MNTTVRTLVTILITIVSSFFLTIVAQLAANSTGYGNTSSLIIALLLFLFLIVWPVQHSYSMYKNRLKEGKSVGKLSFVFRSMGSTLVNFSFTALTILITTTTVSFYLRDSIGGFCRGEGCTGFFIIIPIIIVIYVIVNIMTIVLYLFKIKSLKKSLYNR